MSKKTKTLIACLIVLILGGSFFAYHLIHNSGSNKSTGREINTVDYSGPTDEEIDAGDNQKEENIKEEEAIDNSTNGSLVTVILSDANQYEDVMEVRAYIPNNYEDGKCIATFTKEGATTIITSSNAFRDASTTQCGSNNTPISKFTVKGDWNLSLEYISNSGKSGSLSKVVSVR